MRKVIRFILISSTIDQPTDKISVIYLIDEETAGLGFFSSYISVVIRCHCYSTVKHRRCVNLVGIATNDSAQIISMFNPVIGYLCIRSSSHMCLCFSTCLTMCVRDFECFKSQFKKGAQRHPVYKSFFSCRCHRSPLAWTWAYQCAHTLCAMSEHEQRLGQSKPTLSIANFKLKIKNQRAMSHFSFDGPVVQSDNVRAVWIVCGIIGIGIIRNSTYK